jgi:hypothetical protein
MPRIKMTRTVRVALWALRIYLLILLTLIAIKFIRVFTAPARQQALPPAQTEKGIRGLRGVAGVRGVQGVQE